MKVLIPQDISEVGKSYLCERGYKIKVLSRYDEDTLVKEVKDCDALLVRTAKITSRVLEAGTSLKVIAKHGVGVDNIDIQAAARMGIRVTNAPESNANCVAEHTVALILAVTHQMHILDAAVRNDDWDIRNRINLMELQGKTVGIIGLGRIGKLVAQKMNQGFGMKVIAYNRSVSKSIPPYIEMKNRAEDVYGDADIVCIHLPLTDETKKSVNMGCFQRMKSSAFLINSGRGEIIDEEDLYQALSERLIAGAGLDVLEHEPPQKNNKLLTCQNIVFSPHCGAHSRESFEKMALHAAIGVDEVLSGKEVSWLVC